MFGKFGGKKKDPLAQLMESAHLARLRGDSAGAAAGYREAADLIREFAQEGQDVSPGQLGSLFYSLGQHLLDVGAPKEAITLLDEAEQAYVSLGAEMTMVADVRLRRGMAHMLLDHRASALVDAQMAVQIYRERFTGEDDDPLVLDLARVLARHGVITLYTGDPDVAVAAADQAIRVYLRLASEINSDEGKLAVHGRAFQIAAEVAAAVHGAYGRSAPAAAADDLAEQVRDSMVVLGSPDGGRVRTTVGGDRIDLPGSEAIRAKVTLAEALDAVRCHELREELTRPALACEILTVADRVSPQLSPVFAARLAGVVEGAIDDAPEAAMRIALEAHGMFAVASEYRTSQMRFKLHEFGPDWARMLMRCSKAAEESGLRALALDLARWMGGVAVQLMPHALVSTTVRSVVLNCMDWHADLLTANGDAAAADEVRAAAANLA